MNVRLALVATSAVLAIVGCGKTIPECGDPKVTALVTQVLSQQFEKTVAGQLQGMFTMFGGVQVKAKPALKYDAISSTKRDTDSGFNFCAAKLTGSFTYEAAMAMGNNGPFGAIALMQVEAMKMNPQFKNVQADGSKVTYVIEEVVDSKVTYSANISEKGDQLVVNLLKAD